MGRILAAVLVAGACSRSDELRRPEPPAPSTVEPAGQDPGPPEPAPTAQPPVEADAVPSLDTLVGELEPVRLGDGGTALGSLLRCPNIYEDCSLASRAAYDESARRWVSLEVEFGEGTAESVRLALVTPGERTVVYDHDLEGDDAFRVNLRPLVRAMRPYAALTTARSIVTETAYATFSLNTYTVLAALADPLAGKLLYLETSTDLDDPVAILWLVDRGTLEKTELARRPTRRAPCDGDGYYCDAHADTDMPCTAEELRAEGRLCVEPLGIGTVAVAPDRSSLFVLGIRQVAGHGGYPPFSWAVALPPDASTPP
jgi:hypothetical protein